MPNSTESRSRIVRVSKAQTLCYTIFASSLITKSLCSITLDTCYVLSTKLLIIQCPEGTINELPAPCFRRESKHFLFPHNFRLVGRGTSSEARERESWADRVHGDALRGRETELQGLSKENTKQFGIEVLIIVQ